MPEMRRNNLGRATSPYLRQHACNPIWWQEWSREAIDYAVREDKPLFVSVGYATCHWCHVMAAEAFSHGPTAEFLNQNFICVKVDREQRPDIDQYLMRFLTEHSGSGGWPLNAFLTPRLSPIFACTYCPAEAGRGMNTLLGIARAVRDFYAEKGGSIPDFSPSDGVGDAAALEELAPVLAGMHDPLAGGFGTGQKFPPHTTLLFLLYYLCAERDPEVEHICVRTLDAMRMGGLHDHLQGGIFRYCVDREWTIPHFEKMLYDQALALWCYALAHKVLGNEAYKTMALQVVRCLDETFAKEGLFISAHDADTEHHEGATYLWRYDELSRLLSPDELASFGGAYRGIDPTGNLEGAIHLVRKTDTALRKVEEKLLAARRTRPQPHTDDKVLCGLNALTAMAFIEAARLLGRPDMEVRAGEIVRRLVRVFWDGQSLAHCLYDGVLQEQSYLFDAAALLAAVSFLCETDPSWHDTMTALAAYVETFRDGDGWLESRAEDFRPVQASWFDHPSPSSAALAELATTRVRILTGQPVEAAAYRRPFESDFHNIVALIRNGLFHQITADRSLDWSHLPANTIQVQGERGSDCYRGACHDLPLESSGGSTLAAP